MTAECICLVGGTGFVGRSLAAQLTALGHPVRILTRRRERHRELLVLPAAEVVEGDVHNPEFLRHAFRDCRAAVNLVGILNERGRDGTGFRRAHVELVEKIVAAAQASGVRRLLHMCALHASTQGPSRYLRTKGQGEELALGAHGPALAVTSFRPSVIFGPRDSFTNRFAGLLRLAPGVFPLACPDARFQPVYVEDVARAFARALEDHRTFGQRYNLCGPKAYTLQALVEYIAGRIGKRVRVIGLNNAASLLQAAIMEFVPGKPFSLDNYRSLTIDSVCPQGFPAVFAIAPQSLEDSAPAWLAQPGRDTRYAVFRQRARR